MIVESFASHHAYELQGLIQGGVDGVASHPPHQNNKNQDNKEMIDTLTWWCATTMSQHENDRSASELPCISHAKFNSSTASHPPSLNPESAPELTIHIVQSCLICYSISETSICLFRGAYYQCQYSFGIVSVLSIDCLGAGIDCCKYAFRMGIEFPPLAFLVASQCRECHC